MKVYYLNVEFINDYGIEPVTVFWQINGTTTEQIVPPKGEMFMESTSAALTQPPPIYLQGRIEANNQSVMLNGQQIYPLIPTELLNRVKVTFGDSKLLVENFLNKAFEISVQVKFIFLWFQCIFYFNILAVSPGPTRVYYINLEVSNLGKDSVTIKWKDMEGNEQKQVSAGGSVTEMAMAMTASTQPDNFEFTGVNTNGQRVYLNNATTFEVTPSTNKQLVKIIIGKQDLSKKMFIILFVICRNVN